MIGCIAVNGPANLPAMNQSSDDDYETYRCREVTCSPSSGKHILIGLHPYGEYFVVAFKASDPHSIALVSDSCTPGAYVPFVSPVVKTEPSYSKLYEIMCTDITECTDPVPSSGRPSHAIGFTRAPRLASGKRDEYSHHRHFKRRCRGDQFADDACQICLVYQAPACESSMSCTKNKGSYFETAFTSFRFQNRSTEDRTEDTNI